MIAENTADSHVYYNNVDYFNENTVQAILRHIEECRTICERTSNFGLFHLYLDIKLAIENTPFTDKQRNVLELYMKGYTETEIGQKLGGVSHQAIHKIVIAISNKISKYLIYRVAK